MKECPIALVQIGKSCHIHANIFLQFSKRFSAWDWNSLSVLYQKLPFLTLDESFESERKTEIL